jgi:hypothetical protein
VSLASPSGFIVARHRSSFNFAEKTMHQLRFHKLAFI